VLVGRDPHEARARERADAEVDRPRPLFRDDVRDGRVRLDGELPRDRRQHLLERNAIVRGEHRAQDLVALGEGLERAAQRLDIERSAEPADEREQVGVRLGIELVEEPQSLLRA